MDYRGEFFSWVWWLCMSQLAENQGRDTTQLYSEMEGQLFETLAAQTQDVVQGLDPEEREKAYQYLRGECTHGHVDESYLPTWKVGKAPF